MVTLFSYIPFFTAWMLALLIGGFISDNFM